MSEYVYNLKEVKKEDVLIAGGKASNLGEMIGSGLRVPEGFVVLTKGYNLFIKENGIDKEIENVVRGLVADDMEKLDKASETISKIIDKAPIPAKLIEEIGAHYSKLGGSFVAIRSSATAEDLPGMSFAGQYDTYLNIKGIDEVLLHVKKCWASLWNARALSYRIRYGVDAEELAHGVVVQRLVDGEVSGILFTANPVNGRRDQMLLNASWGLGEAVVGGEVTPDQWVTDTEGKIFEKNINKKEIMTVRIEGGTEEASVPSEKQEEPSLEDRQVRMIIEMGANAEKLFGSPQDIEWTIEGGKFYLLQARPITSLYPVPETDQEGLRAFINFNVASQQMVEPFTPMGEEVFRLMLSGMYNDISGKAENRYPWWFKSVGGQIFIDITPMLRTERAKNKLISAQNIKAPMTSKSIEHLADIYKDEFKGKGFRLPLSILKLVPSMGGAAIIGKLSPEKGREKAIELGENLLERLTIESKDLSGVDEKLDFIENSVSQNFMALWQQSLYVAPAFDGIDKAEKMLKEQLGDSSRLEAVRHGLPGNPTTEMGLSLVKAAKSIKERGGNIDKDAPEVRAFLEKYGHRSTTEVDLGVPSWSEDPEYVLNMIESYIEQENFDEIIEKFERDNKEGWKAIDDIFYEMNAKGLGSKAKGIKRILTNYRKIGGLRELPKFHLTKGLSIFRGILLEVGNSLKEQGRIETPEDVFFLRFSDIRGGSNLKEKVKENREVYQKELERRSVPLAVLSNGHTVFSVSGKGGANTLVGIPVSPGVYEGNARVIMDPKGAKLNKGEILVTRGTNPAWTPLFLNSGALVMETGGPISHGSIVAREYGIPAVAGVQDAISRISSGQKIRVNGETGQVDLLE